MGEPPQACLDAADHDGNVAVGLTHAVRVYYCGPVGPEPCCASGRVVVFFTRSFSGCIVGDHRVEVAARDAEEETRFPEPPEIVCLSPIRLGNDAHPEPGRLEDPPDHRRAVGRMVDIGVAGDKDDVGAVPSP